MTCAHPPVRDQISLESGPRAPSAARRFVSEAAAGCDPGVIADAQLLVSELVSNVVRHTRRDRLTVSVETAADGALRVEVAHRGRGFRPTLRRRAADRMSGWGLEIVDRMSRRWGVHGEPRATVWFEVGGAQ